MEASLEVYGKMLDLFSTMNEATGYIKDKTREGDFETCLGLLDDMKAAADEIRDSGIILLARIDQVLDVQVSFDKETQYLEFTAELERLEQAYGQANVDVSLSIIEHSVEPSLQSWHKDIVDQLGSILAS